MSLSNVGRETSSSDYRVKFKINKGNNERLVSCVQYCHTVTGSRDVFVRLSQFSVEFMSFFFSTVFVCSPVVLTSKHYVLRILFSLHFCTKLKARICFCALFLDVMQCLKNISIHQLFLDPAATGLVCMCCLLKSTTAGNKNIIITHALQTVTVFLSHHSMFDTLL